MKYILMCIAALAACLICAWLPARMIGKKKKLSGLKTALLAVAFGLVLICAVSFGYLNSYYHADADALADVNAAAGVDADMASDDAANAVPAVRMEKIDGGYFFDGPGEDTALIFYQGAKVETLAYAPLMNALAERGVDCFLADLPFRMAVFGGDTAERFMNAYTYEHWATAGHSMGGLVISGYAAEHADQVDMLVLLASYPGSRIPDSIALCSIYGSLDSVLNREVYETSKEYWPERSTEYVLEGGNHAQYANYGPQAGDLEATITREEQQRQTAEIIARELGL